MLTNSQVERLKKIFEDEIFPVLAENEEAFHHFSEEAHQFLDGYNRVIDEKEEKNDN